MSGGQQKPHTFGGKLDSRYFYKPNPKLFFSKQAGSEEGYVCLFEICEEGLMYYKVFDKQEGKVFFYSAVKTFQTFCCFFFSIRPHSFFGLAQFRRLYRHRFIRRNKSMERSNGPRR